MVHRPSSMVHGPSSMSIASRPLSVGHRPTPSRGASLARLGRLECLGAADSAEKGGVAQRGAPGSERHDHNAIAFFDRGASSPARHTPKAIGLLTVARSVQCATPGHSAQFSAVLRAIRASNAFQPDQARQTRPAHRTGATMDYGLWTMNDGPWTMDHGPGSELASP